MKKTNKNLYTGFKVFPKNVQGRLKIIENKNFKEKLLVLSSLNGKKEISFREIDPSGEGRFKLSEKREKITIFHRNKTSFNRILSHIQEKIRVVNIGFLVSLKIVGVGYRVYIKENTFYFKIGYAEYVKYSLPISVKGFTVSNTLFSVYGVDKNIVKEIGCKIRRIRPPENYKGKGIRFVNEEVKILQGKRK